MTNILKGYIPICVLSKDIFLFYKEAWIYSIEFPSEKIKRITKLNISKFELLLYKIPYAVRMLRLGVRCSLKISEYQILFVINKRIYELNLLSRKISNGFKAPENCRPLYLTLIEGASGFEDGVYFGGYLTNFAKRSVPIYKRVGEDNWIIVYLFPQGAIDHVHNIVFDKKSDSVFVFTGDSDQSAAIWIAKEEFTKIEPIFIGQQTFRVCAAFTTPAGLLFATDSPDSENSIRLLKKDMNNSWVSEFIQKINGPVIYGCEWGLDFVFSTGVEYHGNPQNIFINLFNRIIGNRKNICYSYVYKGNLVDGFKIIYMISKDILPVFLFQLGSLIFLSGKNNSTYLPIYHLATEKYDNSTIILKHEEL